MAYRLNLADNRLLILVFDQSWLPITDILSFLSFIDILEIADIIIPDWDPPGNPCIYPAPGRRGAPGVGYVKRNENDEFAGS